MDKTRKLSTVVFYQPDEESVLSRPGEGPEPTPEEVTSATAAFRKISSSQKRPSLSIIRKNTESEDSGVKSEDDGNSATQPWRARSNSRWSRFSRNVSFSSTISPLWDFPSFDELFNSGGKATLALHRSPTSISDLMPRSPTSTSSLGGESTRLEEESETSATSGQPNMESRQSGLSGISRQDSIMSQSFRSLLFKSWEGSHNSFVNFRSRLGGSVRHKYCMCCRITSMPFVFANVAIGMFITCVAVLCFIHCQDELMMTVYVLVNGLLSVFFFPTLIMAWNKRVGGCVNESKKGEDDKEESPAFFIVTLLCRIISSITGTVLLVYRYYWMGPEWDSTLCEVEFFMTFAVITMEWTLLVLFLIFPIIIYFCFYRVAPYLPDDFEDELRITPEMFNE
ncbi:uncharacterized protein LOC110445639 [Mizuhopecten yessoensis]|uniref:Transmembrane protein n=1 Tax=Mizuhopecten yessoensis TaxID=6573 RepID=A0A210QZI4_MIZYE|nr:uncharacterized protein LOC110445639 [Mizuhopecten yessoensis]OWF54051.1 hypothetical protein KP79_PYT15268 [Mizuhopecten yessoensis]